MTSTTMTVRLEDGLKKRLEKLSEVTHRTKSYLAAEAIREFIGIQEWQLIEIEKGIAEANANQLIDHNDLVTYWEGKRADSMDNRG